MELLVVKDVKFPDKEVLATIMLTQDLKLGLGSLNLMLFLHHQITLRILMIAAAITNIPCLLHPLLQT
jgi:hypothetical protein